MDLYSSETQTHVGNQKITKQIQLNSYRKMLKLLIQCFFPAHYGLLSFFINFCLLSTHFYTFHRAITNAVSAPRRASIYIGQHNTQQRSHKSTTEVVDTPTIPSGRVATLTYIKNQLTLVVQTNIEIGRGQKSTKCINSKNPI